MSDRTVRRRHLALTLAVATLALAAVPAARGGLIASFALHELVAASLDISATGPVSGSAHLDAATLPVHQTISVPLGNQYPGAFGATITSTYDVTDVGATATYSLTSQGLLYGPGLLGAGSENDPGGYGPTSTQFVLSAPAIFVATLTASGPLTTETEGNLAAIDGFNATTVFDLGSGTASGTLVAGVPYTIYDRFFMTNTFTGGPAGNGSGTFNFTLTLTAVPEPATAGVLAVAAAGLLGRRGRRR